MNQYAFTPEERARYERLWQAARRERGVSLGRDAWRRLSRSWRAMTALAALVLLVLVALLAPLWPLQPPALVNTGRTLEPPRLWPLVAPSAEWVDEATGQILEDRLAEGYPGVAGPHRWLLDVRARLFGRWQFGSLLGTDLLGRDLLSRLVWGARVSLLVGLIATFVSVGIGVTWGALAGYLGGWADDAMMRFVDVLYSIPFVFLYLFLAAVLTKNPEGPNPEWGLERMTLFYLVVAAFFWLTMSRVVRGQVISLKQQQFIEAARTIGAGRLRIVFRHLVPNVLSIVIVYLTLTIPRVMLFEAFLSFLGLGVESPSVSWGVLANEGVQEITPIRTNWWLVVFPGVALGATLFSLNVLGDALRDALDPRLKHR